MVHGTSQKIAFGGLGIGFLMFTVATASPFWLELKIWTGRIASLISIGVSLGCVLVAIWQSWHGIAGKTIFHGIIAFISGTAGAITIATFAALTTDGKTIPFYGWSYYVYIFTDAIVVLVSFMLCFATPKNPNSLKSFTTKTAGTGDTIVTSSQQYSNTHIVHACQQEPPTSQQHYYPYPVEHEA